ncbi:MAG: hypothetical protein H6926_06790 [Chromatiales bacterium]|nr:hypothetical protein [Chromatiales bacterium]
MPGTELGRWTEHVSFSKRELQIKSWLGLPSSIIALFIALIHGGKGWWVYLGILVIGWYLYTLLYWKLYQRYMLNKAVKEKGKFYGFLIGYQLSLFSVVLLYAFQP